MENTKLTIPKIFEDENLLIELYKIYVGLVHTYSDRISKNLTLYITLITALLSTSIYIIVDIVTNDKIIMTQSIKSIFIFIPVISILLCIGAQMGLKRESIRVFRYVAMMKKLEDLLGLTVNQQLLLSKYRINFFNEDEYFLIDDYVKPFIEMKSNDKKYSSHKFVHESLKRRENIYKSNSRIYWLFIATNILYFVGILIWIYY